MLYEDVVECYRCNAIYIFSGLVTEIIENIKKIYI